MAILPVVGAYFDDVGTVVGAGSACFTRTGTTWTQQQKLTASDGGANDFGINVAISGDTVLLVLLKMTSAQIPIKVQFFTR